ncbi:ABC transporter ATP-binding protein/permease [Belliella sp. DSM 107340]|uniref:ABC transporter ATP-binding protein/permease n=1 Tax=Belliella calami TaxID=2923436 RepID=A0ABS9UUV3_9BACT|nr:ABC transporter ATP-binding protein [Belliella calami]MCH7400200.1 ABC transporter ATP-binding protein/permease [Belliella calami]
MHTYFRLLSYARPISKYAFPYLLLIILATIFNTLNIALLAPLLSTLFEEQQNLTAIKPDSWLDIMGWFDYLTLSANINFGAQKALKWTCLAILSSVLLSNIFKYFSQRIMENLRIQTLLNLRKTLFDHVMNMDMLYFNDQRKGNIIAKIASDVQVVQFSVTNTLQVLFKEPFQLIAYLFVLFAISFKLTLFSILVLPLSAWVISKIVRKLKAQAKEAQERFGMMISYLDEALSGIRIIKGFNATSRIKDRFHQENIQYSELGRKMAYRQQLGSPVSEFLGVLMVTILVLYGGNLVIQGQGDLSAAAFITYIAIFSQIMRPAKALTESFSMINTGLAAGERVLELIDEKPKHEELQGNIAVKELKDKIRFNQVSFAYQKELVLNNVSFDIERGKTVALVGPSGAGKSTLMDLIPKFIHPLSGEISFDGISFSNVSSESLRSIIGIVNQDSILFNDSIKNNIAFANPNASENQIMEAAKIANAHDFIMETENGYDTNIGDRGVKLSGGQKQRICIARAVLMNPPVLLLDEATSSLDAESEYLVQDALNKLMENRTSLIIAHRLSTIQKADLILVLDQGKVAEQGTHFELLFKEGIYSRLIDKQQFKKA